MQLLSIGDINDIHNYCHKVQTYDDQYDSKFESDWWDSDKARILFGNYYQFVNNNV